METYYVYRINFQPEPVIQGSMEKFDTKETAIQFINKKSHTYEGSKWFIVKKTSSSSESYQLEEIF